MTAQEFKNWMEKTKFSEKKWTFDNVTYANRKAMLFYKGGMNGQFINIESDGLVQIGDYEEAYPHIAEAFFKVRHERVVAKNGDEALSFITQKLGVQFLIDMVS
jgi:hypothetical protein